MPHEIVISGKKYIDLALLTDKLAILHPFKLHTLRRLTIYGRITSHRFGAGLKRKYWFDFDKVKTEIANLLEHDSSTIEVNENAGAELNCYLSEFESTNTPLAPIVENDCNEVVEDYLSDL